MNSHDKKVDPKADPKLEKKPEGPPIQEYPKVLNHPDGRTRTVASAEEEAQAKTEGFVVTVPPKAEPKAEHR